MKGVSMCKVIEDMRKEERIEIAKNMLLDGMLSLEKLQSMPGFLLTM